MTHREPEQSGISELLRENEELRRQIAALKGAPGAAERKAWRPSSTAIWAIFLLAMALTAVAFLAGYRPLVERRETIAAESREEAQAIERVKVIEVRRAAGGASIELPGNVEAITEAPVLARADGYLAQRLVDIGDRVRAGQTLARIEAPEVDEQIRQARAALVQAQAAVEQATANLERGRSDEALAKVTADRWAALLKKGVVSKQDNDQHQSEYRSAQAAANALEKAVAMARSNVGAAQANLARLDQVQGYREVKAPFDGVITLRNVDVGALVNAGSTLLYRIAQISSLRTYVNVPQAEASAVREGQAARLTFSNFPGRTFAGAVARTASALDPASRTLLVEVRVPNPDAALLPGMYARVSLASTSAHGALRVPSDALIVRAEGTEVAVVRGGHTVHLQKIAVGRDYGDSIEVMSGLEEGDLVIANPGDVLREGSQVQPVGTK
jgi:RND family efflux transporter MFP subunit